jgi:hypothetical protein
VSEQSIRQHLRSALDAIVAREQARLRDATGGADTRESARIRTMRPLVEALRTVANDTGGVDGLSIQVAPDGGRAGIEMLEAGGSRRALAISTDAACSRFEVEEAQYFPLSGDRVSYLHCFDAPEDVLHFALEMIGTHIASRRVPAGKPG